MSLINDALKRAKQAQQRRTPSVVSDPPLEPVVHAASAPWANVWALTAAAIVTLLLSCWFIGLWWRTSRQVVSGQTSTRATTERVVSEPKTKAAEARTPALDPTNAPSKTSITESPSVTAVASIAALSSAISTNKASASSVTNANAPTSGGQIPELAKNNAALEPVSSEQLASQFKLQGIFYRTSKASAVINGQTLFAGDEIDGAKVVSIERSGVRLLMSGRTNLLKLR
jgi:hypothetical protein